MLEFGSESELRRPFPDLLRTFPHYLSKPKSAGRRKHLSTCCGCPVALRLILNSDYGKCCRRRLIGCSIGSEMRVAANSTPLSSANGCVERENTGTLNRNYLRFTPGVLDSTSTGLAVKDTQGITPSDDLPRRVLFSIRKSKLDNELGSKLAGFSVIFTSFGE